VYDEVIDAFSDVLLCGVVVPSAAGVIVVSTVHPTNTVIFCQANKVLRNRNEMKTHIETHVELVAWHSG